MQMRFVNSAPRRGSVNQRDEGWKESDRTLLKRHCNDKNICTCLDFFMIFFFFLLFFLSFLFFSLLFNSRHEHTCLSISFDFLLFFIFRPSFFFFFAVNFVSTSIYICFSPVSPPLFFPMLRCNFYLARIVLCREYNIVHCFENKTGIFFFFGC